MTKTHLNTPCTNSTHELNDLPQSCTNSIHEPNDLPQSPAATCLAVVCWESRGEGEKGGMRWGGGSW